jgi:hypothetical protein
MGWSRHENIIEFIHMSWRRHQTIKEDIGGSAAGIHYSFKASDVL